MESPALTPSREQKLRVFFSADLANATDYKARHSRTGFLRQDWSRQPLESEAMGRWLARYWQDTWPSFFGQFFQDFARAFFSHIRGARADAGITPPLARPLPTLWKINGDEILFVDFIYPEHEPESGDLVYSSVKAFVQTVKEFDTRLLPKGIGVRGCVWSNGFPIRNSELIVEYGKIPVIASHRALDDGDASASADELQRNRVLDYIGPDIDLGFRLASATPAARVACSLDVAWRLVAGARTPPRPNPVQIHHVGWRSFKGIAAGNPYPLLWLEVTDPAPRQPWDESESFGSPETKVLLSGQSKQTSDSIRQLAAGMWKALPEYLIRPYASAQEMDRSHEALWRALNSTGVEVGPIYVQGDGSGRVRASVEQDVLDQLHRIIRSDPEERAVLRDVLRQIAARDEYAEWERTEQYSGSPFLLPPNVHLRNDAEQRALERFGLVGGDELRVRISTDGETLLLTDGLWVPREVRVFPFRDESDLLLRHAREMVLTEWTTFLVDPGTGCGHTVLRFANGMPIARCGFDVSARALTYAALNACINDIDSPLLALHDIDVGLPRFLSGVVGERILILANMPFALSPRSIRNDVSLGGGPYGYELTTAVFEAMKRAEDENEGRSEFRAVVLAYSVGRKLDEQWYVAERARAIFGHERITWHLLEDERLWRVNGKKEQPNPMPLSALSLKAECRFTFPERTDRAALARDYDALTDRLRQEGFDHLAYGIVEIGERRPS